MLSDEPSGALFDRLCTSLPLSATSRPSMPCNPPQASFYGFWGVVEGPRKKIGSGASWQAVLKGGGGGAETKLKHQGRLGRLSPSVLLIFPYVSLCFFVRQEKRRPTGRLVPCSAMGQGGVGGRGQEPWISWFCSPGSRTHTPPRTRRIPMMCHWAVQIKHKEKQQNHNLHNPTQQL